MKKLLITAAASMALAGMAAPAFATDYLPFGPQENVALATVLGGGWSLCYSAPMSTFLGASASDALGACGTGKIMLAGRETGSDTLITLAEADYADVFFNTGQNSNVTHNANGAEWYNADNFSWGFAPGGQGVTKGECDVAEGVGRICLHTVGGAGGYRIDNNLGLNGSNNFEKLVFAFNGTSGAVPEPATWALMIGGFGMAGAALRRRRAVAA
jgi:hypothetical protein